MDPAKKEQKQRERMAVFIEATSSIIEEEGIEAVSIRRIAQRAGYHNSSIYFYFHDVNVLIALACVRYFEQYSRRLAAIRPDSQDSYHTFFQIWEFFCESAFSYPEIFRHLFFGNYDGNLTSILNQYYDIYPEQKEALSDVVKQMYFGRDIFERSALIQKQITGDIRVRVKESQLEMVVSVTVSVFRSLLEQKCADPSLDAKQLTEHFMEVLHYLVDA